MTTDLPFAPEIAEAAHAIQRNVAAGENDALQHAWHIANAVEQMLERHFPDLPTANALDPQETVERLLAFYAETHEDSANGPAPVAELS